MSLIKYRVHEVAKDFNLGSKDISNILTEYATTPKNHMQVLEDEELSLIFEYLTQHHQMQDISEVYAVPEPPKTEKKKEEPAADGKKDDGKKAPAASEKSAPAQQPQPRVYVLLFLLSNCMGLYSCQKSYRQPLLPYCR